MSIFKHPQFLGLYQDVVLHPTQDEPRLIFADWLEDHGQEARAQFIRLQIQAAALSNEADRDTDWWAAHGPARALLEELQERWPGWLTPGASLTAGHYAWAGTVAHLTDPDHRGWEFRRGFVHTVRCSRANWLHVEPFGPHYVANQPIERVELTDCPEDRIEYLRGQEAPVLRRGSWPADIWAYLQPDRCAEMRLFANRKALHNHVSKGLVAWARDQAVKRGLLPHRVQV